MILSRIRCMDCNQDTGARGLKEYPTMLCDEVWRSITADTGGAGVLCRADMERRLGRPLTEADMMPSTRDRIPFTSGLPGECRAPSPEHREGLRKLDAIRALALDRIEANRPFARDRFDGVERQHADPIAIAETATDADIVRLVDLVLSDEVLKTAVTARLGRGGR